MILVDWWNKANRAITDFLIKVAGGKDKPWYPWVREAAHFTGATFIGLVTHLITLAWHGPWMWIVSGVLLYTSLIIMEIGDVKGGQTWYKTVMDFTFWTLGFIWIFLVTRL